MSSTKSQTELSTRVRSGRSAATPGTSVFSDLELQTILVPIPDEVAAYFDQHPQLRDLLPQIGARVRQAFGDAVELTLIVYKDPEIDDRYLTLRLRQPHYEADVLDRIDCVSREFDDLLQDIPGYLLITTDFQRPGGSNVL